MLENRFSDTRKSPYPGWEQKADPGSDWGDRLPKTYECNFIHHDFVQFVKQHSRYKAILPSIVSSQHCCEVYFISPIVVNQ